jgi:L-lactate dehydrogenase complex protein LldE
VKVALLTTCLVDAMFPEVGKATVTVLRRLGINVDVPRDQSCCGQMHVNSGYPKQAAALARRQAEVFAGFDAVVLPSGSCAGSVRHQWPADTDTGRARYYELSEFLVDVLGVTDVGAYFPHRVTWHPTCHSLRVLRVGDRPLRLLRAVEGLELVELPDATSCCGFGGTFALKNEAVSSAMLQDKVDHIVGTEAAVVSAGDASCLMHIGGGLSRLSVGTRPVHLAEILASTR